MLIDLVIISKLGESDGGRETWLQNFLLESNRRKGNYAFNIFSLSKSPNNVISALYKKTNIINDDIEYNGNWWKLPVSIVFFIKFFFRNFIKKKVARHVIAVGGLEEAISVTAAYCIKPVSGKKILWLRTIYTKEKGYRFKGIVQKIILQLEIFVIKNFFDIVIANGDDTAYFYRKLGINCVVIKNAIDLKNWSTIKNTRSKNTRIAFIGRLAQIKGLDCFLDSVISTKKEKIGTEIDFHVVGDGPLKFVVENCHKNRLLTYHGSLPNSEIPKFLANVDCCVALTLSKENLGGGGVSNALLEQMAAGKIIIAWSNNIFKSVLTENTAYFSEQENIESLVQNYKIIHLNKKDAAFKSEAARQASEAYSIEHHVSNFFQLIE